MKNFAHLGPIQNLGWLDRTIRVIIGFALVFTVLFEFQKTGDLGGYAYLPILAIYPFLTAVLGWDPLYSASNIRSCGGSDRNKCGTYPFEIESALGKKPECNEGFDCSVPGDHHAHERPAHHH
jgi:hypothetical protein